MLPILNASLLWNGDYLGDAKILNKWLRSNNVYYTIQLLNEENEGIIHCQLCKTKNVFPCIIEELKNEFGIIRRGCHRVVIERKLHIVYFLPLVNNNIVYDEQLNNISLKHEIRNNLQFINHIQHIFAFCELFGLTNTKESSILLRNIEGEDVPIPININNSKISIVNGSEYTVLSVPIFERWFDESVNVNDIIKDIVGYQIYTIKPEIEDNMAQLLFEIRKLVEDVIRKYDVSYLWYSAIVVDRLSRALVC